MPNYIHAIALPVDDRKRRIAAKSPKTPENSLRSTRPSLRDRALELARGRDFVTTKELQAVGVHRCYLTPMCEEGLLVRVGHGRYRAAKSDRGAM